MGKEELLGGKVPACTLAHTHHCNTSNLDNRRCMFVGIRGKCLPDWTPISSSMINPAFEFITSVNKREWRMRRNFDMNNSPKGNSILNIISEFFLSKAQCASASHISDETPDEGNCDVPAGSEEDSLPGVRIRRERSSMHQKQLDSELVHMEINRWLERQTGKDRLWDAYSLTSEYKFAHEDTRNLVTMTNRAVLMSIFASMAIASQTIGKKKKYLSRTETAVRGPLATKAISKEVLKNALKFTLRMSAAAVTLLHLPHVIATYRNKTTMWEFALASTLSFGMMGRGSGSAVLKKSAGGALLGVVGGYFITEFLGHQGLSQEHRNMDRIKERIIDQRKFNQSGGDTKDILR